MDVTNFSQTMDIDIDFDGNQSCQPTKMMSMFMNNQHTFNFEDTEITFEFTRYIQQLCHEMEEAKNRLDGGADHESIKSLLNNLLDKVQKDISIVNQSMTNSLNGTLANQSVINQSIVNQTVVNDQAAPNPSITIKNVTFGNTPTLNRTSNTKNETSILGLLHDLFKEKEDSNPIENISKLNILSRSLKDASSVLSNISMNQTVNNTTISDRSILKSTREENTENKENTSTNETFQEPSGLGIAEATFINQSVLNPLMELVAAVEKNIDIERVEGELKAKYEAQLKEKDERLNELEQNLLELQESLNQKSSDHESAIEQLERAKKENVVLDEIISDEKRKLEEKQSTIEVLNVRISQNMNEISSIKEKNIELSKEVNRLSVMEKQNQSLNEQVNDLMSKTNKMFELEKKITMLNVDCNEKQTQIENIRYELKTNIELNERLSKERMDLMNRLDVLMKEDSDKACIINELRNESTNLNAQLSLQNDKCDFLEVKLKDTSALKNQLDKDRKDICWQINDLLNNPDVDFDDLKTFLLRVEEKINNADTKKPKGAAFVESLAGQTASKV